MNLRFFTCQVASNISLTGVVSRWAALRLHLFFAIPHVTLSDTGVFLWIGAGRHGMTYIVQIPLIFQKLQCFGKKMLVVESSMGWGRFVFLREHSLWVNTSE